MSKNFKKITQLQLTFDSLLPYALAFAPFFIYELATQDENNPTFTTNQLILTNVTLILNYCAQGIYSFALIYGKAGRVQAIESVQGILTVLLAIFILNQMPNVFEYVGIALGVIGVLIIAL